VTGKEPKEPRKPDLRRYGVRADYSRKAGFVTADAALGPKRLVAVILRPAPPNRRLADSHNVSGSYGSESGNRRRRQEFQIAQAVCSRAKNYDRPPSEVLLVGDVLVDGDQNVEACRFSSIASLLTRSDPVAFD
jgi:hypothetical protein